MRHLVFVLALAACSPSVTETRSPNDGVIATALNHLGLHEQKNRDELTTKLGVDPVTTEWCAAFVNAVLSKNDIPGSESVSEYPLTARSFLKWGKPTDDPKKGDIIVFPRGNQGWQGHVGFYVRTEKINGTEYYLVLGGNQEDKVTFDYYPVDFALDVRTY